MSLVFHEYYAMSSKLYFLQTDRKKHLLTFFPPWIDADFNCLSIAFNLVKFQLELVKNLKILNFLNYFYLFYLKTLQNSDGQANRNQLY